MSQRVLYHGLLALLAVGTALWPRLAPAEPPAEPGPAEVQKTDASTQPGEEETDPPVAEPQASACADPQEEAEPADPPWFEQERLTGDWNGARSTLEATGVTFDMTLTMYYQHVVHGGLQTRNAHTIIGINDFELTMDLDAMKLVPGGSIYLWGSNAWGESPSSREWVGDLFWVNGAEVGDRPIDVHELIYEQSLFDGKLVLRMGKVCMSCYFDTNEYAYDTTQDFLNYGLNNAPNIPFPSFAFGALGAVATFTPADWFYAQAGVADADAEFNETGFRTAFHGHDYVFTMFELGLSPTLNTRLGKLPGHYRFGAWYDPRPKERHFNDLGGIRTTVPLKRGDCGVYLNFDQAVFREHPADEEDAQGLGAFLRYSYARGEVNLIERFWSAGLQYQGLLPTRDHDVWGFGAAQGILSDDLRLAGLSPRRETVLETYYRAQIYPWLTVSPDVQWIRRPGGLDGKDAFVAGLRVRVTF